jgi:alanyl-tRNA synthetase
MKSKEIRKKFFDFFIKNGHEKVKSSSLIPAQDPTLLFANAGMNQFKDVFLGKEKRSYTRATSIQKCIRAGGKHNDLDNVGFTKRHLTFFEMMGNFSFGDYFKKEAIEFAWEFLTKDMALPVEKLHVSVYESDQEAYDIWEKHIGIPKEKIHRLGAKENFWQMGDTGPCGPCTEIHIDRGPGSDPDCKSTKCGPECDCDRFLEIWNLVFMQFDRQADGTDKPLKQTGVDTGMGLERLCVVVQNKNSVYETDIFKEIIEKIQELTGVDYKKQDAQTKSAFHVISDHIRSSTMAISDGCMPSNDGRGYVLRKIIRRAALFASKLTNKNILPDLVSTIIQQMGDIYPELKNDAQLIKKIITNETEKFSANLTRGQVILKQYLQDSKDKKLITGEQAFKLYDTYGFPFELTNAAAKEIGYTVDETGFELEMAKQQEQSSKATSTDKPIVELDEKIKTEFTGYEQLETKTEVIAIISEREKESAITSEVQAGQTCWIITKSSPFYIIGGGQEKDSGHVIFDKNKTSQVLDSEKFNNAIGVQIQAPVEIKVGDTVTLKVTTETRQATMRNHTATHLLQAALVKVVGKQVKQAGSLVTPDYLRFDFACNDNLTTEQINNIEKIVNKNIMANIALNIEHSNLNEATKKGVTAFFGEKYNPENVRIVSIPEVSAELCGGTHVASTGEIGIFKITEFTSISAGNKRIFGVTGLAGLELFQYNFDTVKKLGQEFKVQRDQVLDSVEKQKTQLKTLQTQIKNLKQKLLATNLLEWQKEITEIDSIPTLILSLQDGYTGTEIKDIGNALASKKSGLYFILSQLDGQSFFFATISKNLAQNLNLKDLAKHIACEYELKGGGSETMIQGSGPKVSENISSNILNWIKNNKK